MTDNDKGVELDAERQRTQGAVGQHIREGCLVGTQMQDALTGSKMGEECSQQDNKERKMKHHNRQSADTP